MHRTLVIVISMLSLPPLGRGQTTEKARNRNQDKTQDEILQTENRRFAAMVANDFSALDRFLADELTYTHASGRTDSKATFIESLRSGKLKYESINTQEVRARDYGHVAVVTGQAAMKVRAGGQAFSFRIRFIDVYVKRNGRWQMVAWQSTRLPD